MVVTTNEVYQDIISPNQYSLSIHEGSRRHRIRPRRGRKLKFYWNRSLVIRGGRRRVRPSKPVYFEQVRHPGNRRPVKFLTVPLRAAATANGFRFRSNSV